MGNKTGGMFVDLIYNDPLACAGLVLNGDSKAYLEVVTDISLWIRLNSIMKQTIGEIP